MCSRISREICGSTKIFCEHLFPLMFSARAQLPATDFQCVCVWGINKRKHWFSRQYVSSRGLLTLRSHGIYFRCLFRMTEWLDLSGRLKKETHQKDDCYVCCCFLFFVFLNLSRQWLGRKDFDHVHFWCGETNVSLSPTELRGEKVKWGSPEPKSRHTYSRWNCSLSTCIALSKQQCVLQTKQKKLLPASNTNAFASSPLCDLFI